MSIPFADVRRQVEVLQVAERAFDSLILFALFELRVIERLAAGPSPLDALHGALGGDREALRATLDAAVAVGLLTRDEQGYAAGRALTACLGDPRAPAYLGEWITFLAALVPSLARLGETVRSGRPSGSMIDGEGGDDGPARAMTAAMDAYARTRGAELVRHVDVSDARTILDVGCGPGTYALGILEQHPHARAILLDLPGPIARARPIVAARGLLERVTFVAADALRWTPEAPVDVVLVSNVLHMLGPERSRALLVRCLGMTRPGGRLIVQAEFLDEGRASPRWPALLDLVMRVTTEHGRNHTVAETTAWLREAGFTDVERRRLSPWNVNSVLVARRPTGAPPSPRPDTTP